MEKLVGVLEGLAESSERRALAAHKVMDSLVCVHNDPDDPTRYCQYHSELGDFFYWSGKATAYRGIIAMVELQKVVDEELDAEGSCP